MGKPYWVIKRDASYLWFLGEYGSSTWTPSRKRAQRFDTSREAHELALRTERVVKVTRKGKR